MAQSTKKKKNKPGIREKIHSTAHSAPAPGSRDRGAHSRRHRVPVAGPVRGRELL